MPSTPPEKYEAIPVRIIAQHTASTFYVGRTDNQPEYWAVRASSMPYYASVDLRRLFDTQEAAELALAVFRITGKVPSRDELGV